MKDSRSNLTSGRLLAGNTVWNLLGQLLPMLVAVVAVPPLIHAMGVPRFGVLSMAWIVIGYFSLFDLGIGRALTKLVADKLGAGELDDIPPLTWTAMLLMFLLGVLATVVIVVASPWLIHSVLKVPAELQGETLTGFYLLAASVPLVTTTAGWRGVLEAQQRFRLLNLIRIPMSVFSFAGPLLVLPFSHKLGPVIAVLVAGRVIGYLAHQAACFRAFPMLPQNITFQTALVMPLLRIGGWMTVSNMIGPVVLYVDRFLIGALLSLTAVSYYTAPFDMVSRLLVVPTAIAGVLFPAFAVSLTQGAERTALLLTRGTKYVFLAVFPVTLILASLAPEILRVWLGGAFGDHSSTVLRWLAFGILLNSLSVLPFAYLQAAGRPDLTGKLLIAELALFSIVGALLIKPFGIRGAAIVWTVRATLECLALFGLSLRRLPRRSISLAWAGSVAGLMLTTFYLSTLFDKFAARAAVLATTLFAMGFLGWYKIVSSDEKLFFGRILRPSRISTQSMNPQIPACTHLASRADSSRTNNVDDLIPQRASGNGN